MRNVQLKVRTTSDINAQVDKLLRGLGNPEPGISLDVVRDLLRLDRSYYSSGDDSVIRGIVSKLKVAGKQVLMRPMIICDAIRSLNLKALYLPDQKRILLDKSLPALKHRWNEAHEIVHHIIPWHADMMLGDNEQTLAPACHEQIESEANYAAGRILFLAGRFVAEAEATPLGLDEVQRLSKVYKNTITSTLWRYVEQVRPDIPMVGLVTGHPHPDRRKNDFNPTDPCKYFIRSPSFAEKFSTVSEVDIFHRVSMYCGRQKGGRLGEQEIVLIDRNGLEHIFAFETFYNRYQALTLGIYLKTHTTVVQFPTRKRLVF
jgi:hypothetical protein